MKPHWFYWGFDSPINVIVPRVFASRTLRDGNQPIPVCTEGLRWPEHKANVLIVLGSNDTSILSHQLQIFAKV
jgi:hypothetical protein